MTEIKLDKSVNYKGTFMGVSFLITHHGINCDYRPDGTWCFYLFVHEDQLPDEYMDDFILEPKFDDRGRLLHEYYNSRIADIDWHCGITWYSKEGGADGEKITIKMGCDYAHYWDEGHIYNEISVMNDVEAAIKSLFDMFPKLKIRSVYYGGYYDPSEGEVNEHGNFIAFEEKERWAVQHGESND